MSFRLFCSLYCIARENSTKVGRAHQRNGWLLTHQQKSRYDIVPSGRVFRGDWWSSHMERYSDNAPKLQHCDCYENLTAWNRNVRIKESFRCEAPGETSNPLDIKRTAMFGWFKPQCPVDAQAKRWIEFRLQWLSDQFGRDIFTRRAVIQPTKEFFPDPMDGTEESVRNLLDQVCSFMDVDPDRVELELFTNKNELWLVNEDGKYLPTGAAGLYDEQDDKTIIHLETSQLSNLSALVGTMAHELSHLRLMGDGRVSGDEYDNELLTDLTAAFHGFGIFLGNIPRNWDGQYSTWPGTSVRRPEYMTLPMFAYVLAHAAWFRSEQRPSWYPCLSFDLKPCFKQGIRYLMETKDSTFSP